MNPDKLLRMAEQIAVNVTASRDVNVIAERTADHLRRFWDPRMRTQLLAHVDETAPEMADGLRAALALLHQPGRPT